MESPQISIVIPVYNGARYLRATIESILVQSFRDFEVLCINDCSIDNSLAILEDFSDCDKRIIVISTSSNQGYAPKVIKNYGLPRINGEYYTYASQDDLFSEDWLEKMIARGHETGADAVIPDLVFYYETEPSKNHALIGFHGNREAVLSNRQAVELSLDWQIPGSALWRTSLIKKIGYEDFNAYADEYSVRVFFFNCNKVVFSEGIYYYRQDNPQSITKKMSINNFDKPYLYLKLYNFLRTKGFDEDLFTKEILKAVESLIYHKQLILKNPKKISNINLKEADKKTRFYYSSLNSKSEILRIINEQRSVISSLMRWAFNKNYFFFNLVNEYYVIKSKVLDIFR